MVRFASFVLAFTLIVWSPEGSVAGLSQVHVKLRTLPELCKQPQGFSGIEG